MGRVAMTSDQVLTVSFSVSLGVHLFLLVGQLIPFTWWRAPRTHGPIEVVYDYEIAQQELRQLEERLARSKREALSSFSTASAGQPMQVRIPERPSLTAELPIAQALPGRPAVIDLTNLVEASRGDPVLLTYFSAIREQIQHAANHQAWLAGAAAEGMVYVSFMLTSNGAVQTLTIIIERSVPSQALRDLAVRIVKAAAPFPPFPPSMVEPSKTVVVPLEFLFGS